MAGVVRNPPAAVDELVTALPLAEGVALELGELDGGLHLGDPGDSGISLYAPRPDPNSAPHRHRLPQPHKLHR